MPHYSFAFILYPDNSMQKYLFFSCFCCRKLLFYSFTFSESSYWRLFNEKTPQQESFRKKK
ncbi:hypothetical protein HMPREF9151_02351 [Hoylesella saccharolytica F0055]|uniref:Uncharacterized protein n=1 Tax=Hoylesella saccharolytica F0055 TaxID=1127699 RepID=L1N025_9BACT|nr:hypothetical protein HMPREF9151_02351 [Hoylesella saccharolytica F0055]